MHRIIPVSILFLLLSSCLLAQSFSDKTTSLGPTDTYSGAPIGVADMNADGYDDIIRLNNTTDLSIAFQVPGADTLNSVDYGSLAGGGSSWSMSIADIDNDGWNEILTGGSYDSVKILQYNPVADVYDLRFLPNSDIFLQGSNLADIDNDGFLDAFGCHDDEASVIWMNQRNGTFVRDDNQIDLTTTPASDNSGNYGSVWTDFDNDGDLDLYIAKCRQWVNNPKDPRRINMLFVNDGTNRYTESAADFDLAFGDQSWTAEFQDIDNDGDLDAFITNHDAPSVLLENDGTGHFVDITENSGIDIRGLAVQALMKDFDNDGFVDLIVSGSLSFFYKNNGDQTFTEVLGAFGREEIESFAVGDLNHDGFLDVYAGYANVFNTPSIDPDILWINDGNDNNYLKVRLEGTQSNKMGVGARIEIYGSFGVQVREVRAGESYGISNSLIQHFGLGQATTVDRVLVRWPSGNINVINSPAINQQILITESVCNSNVNPQLTVSGPTVVCDGESVALQASGGQHYLWSNGAMTPSISVTESGYYTVYVGDSNDCFQRADGGILVVVDPDETPTLEVEGDLKFCEGESVRLMASSADNYLWSNGAMSQEIEVSESGRYAVSTQGICRSFSSDTIDVEVVPNAVVPSAPDISIPVPGVANLMASGNQPQWYDQAAGGTLLGVGNSFSPNVNGDTTFYVEDVNVFGGERLSVGMIDHEGGSLYSDDNSSAGLTFESFKPFTLMTVKVITDTPGERLIELRSEDGFQVITSRLVNIPVGESRILLEFDISPGNYYLTTNEFTNIDNLGFFSPRLQRTANGAEFPYRADNVMAIWGSLFGGNRYFYFYDWEIQTPFEYCSSERIGVNVDINPVSTYSIDQSNELRLFPNPSQGSFYLETRFEQPQPLHYQVLDSRGILIQEQEYSAPAGTSNMTLDLEHAPSGLYWIYLRSETGTYYGRLIIQE